MKKLNNDCFSEETTCNSKILTCKALGYIAIKLICDSFSTPASLPWSSSESEINAFNSDDIYFQNTCDYSAASDNLLADFEYYQDCKPLGEYINPFFVTIKGWFEIN